MKTIPERFLDQGASRPGQSAYHERIQGSWKATNWETYANQGRTVARALIALGLEPGQRICILGRNTSEWVLADVGAMLVGAVPAGIYATCSPEEVGYIIRHAEAPIVFVQDEAQFAKVAEEKANLPGLKHVILFRGAKVDDELALTWEEFCAKADGVAAEDLDKRVAALEMDSPATFIYTSGTTGPPKAVMLSHRNLAWTADVAAEIISLEPDDCTLSYLPLSHIAEQMFSIHAPIVVGLQVYFFSDDKEKFAEYLQDVQPTIFFGVPRVWEKLHAGVSGALSQATGVKAKLAAWAMGVGTEVNNRRNRGQSVTGLLALKYKLANKIIFSKVKTKIGLGRAKVCVSGAAPVSKEVLEFFAGLDLPVLEVYGQSEDTGPTSFNLPGATRYGTVGRPIPGMDVRIAEDGEIQARGPNVFLGYFKDPEATAATLDGEWLCSGDLGAIDEEGYLRITGRKKEIIITAGGKNISPANIESALRDQELVSQAIVIGDRRKFLSAVITLEPEALERFAAANELVGQADLHTNDKVKAAIQVGVDTVNKKFAQVEHIRKFAVLPRDLDQDNGELTPTLKVKRRVVESNWSDEIEAMYT
jgi:long-chain acyl-CoA synthetase